MVATCKKCGWEGSEAVLEIFRCPSCGSRNIKTSGPKLNKAESLNPPEGARQGE